MSPTIRRVVGLIPLTVTVALVLTFACSLIGCQGGLFAGTAGETAELRQQLEDATGRLAESKDFYEEQMRLGTSAQVAQAQEMLRKIAEMQNYINQTQAAIAKSTQPDGTINAGGVLASAGAMLPPPWNGAALIGSLVVNGIQGYVQRRTAGQRNALGDGIKSMVNAIDKMRVAKPEVAGAMSDPSVKAMLHETITPVAAAIIAEERLT